ncbi:MAG: hypothetical protein NHB32_25165 [Fischerella sp. CENA71]|nr:hypothetical protein [Fischerella sp. CENA71]
MPKEDSTGDSQLPLEANIAQLATEDSTSNSQGGIFMTATFTEDKRLEVEIVIEHLRKLLIGGKVKFHDDKGVVRVSGNFSEDKKLHIEATLDELGERCTSLELT